MSVFSKCHTWWEVERQEGGVQAAQCQGFWGIWFMSVIHHQPWDLTLPLSPRMSLSSHAVSTEVAICISTICRSLVMLPRLNSRPTFLFLTWKNPGATGSPRALLCLSQGQDKKKKKKNVLSCLFSHYCFCPEFQNCITKLQSKKLFFFPFSLSSFFLWPPFPKA